MVLQFRYPLEPCPRVAVVGVPAAGGFGPLVSESEALAAPARVLRSLFIPGWQPVFPLVAFTGVEWGFWTDEDREAIWSRWRVPVFEQLLSASLDVIAEECDAHDGLHLRTDNWAIHEGQLYIEGMPFGAAAQATHYLCACGAATPRLLRVERLAERPPANLKTAGLSKAATPASA